MDRLRPLIRLLFWLALVFALTMALLPHPPRVPGELSDKVQHILAFAVLAALAAAAYPKASLSRIAIGLAAFGILIELLQLIPALNRDAEVSDWIADVAAVLTVLLAARLLRVRRRPERRSR